MSTPMSNLRKTSLPSEKIIQNGLGFRTKGPMPIEAAVYYIRNSPPELMDKENMINNMNNRLANLENEMVGVRKELSKAIEVIKRKDAEITKLKQQLHQQGNQPSSMPLTDRRANKIYKKYDGYRESPDHGYYDRPNIDWEKEYYDLSDHVAEMEKFLADYGMIWVGDKKSADGQDGIIETPIDFVPDFDKIIAIIGELNERTSSESHIKVLGNEARFQKADILNITFYKDGMKLENNPFRKYSTESSLAFFRDLEDGYYPKELKESYPEGVIFKVTDKRSKPYEVSTIEESIFSSPGYRLGTQDSSNKETNQTKVYFQFDMNEKKKQALHKVILKKKPFNESISSVKTKQDRFENYFDPNESRHDGLHNLPYNISIKNRGNKGHMLDISSFKQFLQKYKRSKNKLIQNKRDKKNVFEKHNNFKNTGVRHHVPAESQSVPVLRRNVNDDYFPTGHPQQSRTYKQQEYREYANKRNKGHEMNYNTVSAAHGDNSITTMNTVYDSFCNDSKKTYGATTTLAESRSKQNVDKDSFDTDEEYEHMVIVGKKVEKSNRNNDDYNATESHTEGKESKSKVPTDSEYDAHSSNIKGTRTSSNETAPDRNSIKDSNGLQNSFNDIVIQEGQQHNKTKGINDHKSFSDEQDNTSYGEAKSNMKRYNEHKEGGKIREESSPREAEYDKKHNHNLEDIAVSADKDKILYDDEAENPQAKIKGSNISDEAKQSPDGKEPRKQKLLNDTLDNSKSNMKSYNEHLEEESKRKNFTNPSAKEQDAYSKSAGDTFSEHSGARPVDIDPYDNDKKTKNMFDEEMQNESKVKNNLNGPRNDHNDPTNDPNAPKQLVEDKAYKRTVIPLNNETSEKQEKSNMTPHSEIERQESEGMVSMTMENYEAYTDNIRGMSISMEEHISLKLEGQDLDKLLRDIDSNDERSFSGKQNNKRNIIPSNKRSSVNGSEEDDSSSNFPITTEYADAYGSEIEDNTLIGDRSKHKGKSETAGRSEKVIIQSNKESEDFVLGNEYSKTPATSEYRDAYGTKYKYVVHQCSTNFHKNPMLENHNRSLESKYVKLFSKGKTYEPKIIPLNRKTSDSQIELNMKSYNGNVIYSAYLYPDDSINKVWSLTKLSYEEFVVTVDDKVLHMSVPLKNYNINGDVTLNITKRKPSFLIKELGSYKSKKYDDEVVDYSSDEDYFLDREDNEEGYSS